MQSLEGKPDGLRNYWHPVALSSAVRDEPVQAALLDEELVLWRGKHGLTAFRDLCIHRGTRLSLGWTNETCLVCPYHGWQYNEDGACVLIPSLPADRPIPTKARVKKFHCIEKYGLVFVCLGEPCQSIIDFPEFDDDQYVKFYVGPIEFKADATRSFENFIDDTHLAFVHPGLLGDPNNVKPTPKRLIEEKEGSFYYEVETLIANRSNPSDKTLVPGVITYRVVPPYSMCNGNVFGANRVYSTAFFSSPISENRSVRYLVCARKYEIDKPSQPYIDFVLKVWEQDRPIVESQRPKQVPVDFSEELHLRDPDAPAIVYRRMIRKIGLDAVANT